MPKATDIRILQATAETERFAYRSPIKFGGRVVTDAVLLHVTVDVETRDGRRGRGAGSMPMGNTWAWPTAKVSAEATLAAMIETGRRLYDGRASPGNHPRFGVHLPTHGPHRDRIGIAR